MNLMSKCINNIKYSINKLYYTEYDRTHSRK